MWKYFGFTLLIFTFLTPPLQASYFKDKKGRIDSGTTRPSTCTVGDHFLDTDADTDGSLYSCVSSDTWKEVDDDGGVADHGALTGLSDDDHTQYVLDAGDSMTGALDIKVGALALDIQNTTDSASVQTAIFRGGDRATASNGESAYISYTLDNNAGNQEEVMRFTWKMGRVEANDGEGVFSIEMESNGALVGMILLELNDAFNAFKINDAGIDLDFRIASDVDGELITTNGGTDTVTIGSSVSLAKFGVDGDQDEIQFLVQGHSTQTAGLFTVEKSDGTDMFAIDTEGNAVLTDSRVIVGSEAGGTCSTNLAIDLNTIAKGVITTIGETDVACDISFTNGTAGEILFLSHDYNGTGIVTFADVTGFDASWTPVQSTCSGIDANVTAAANDHFYITGVMTSGTEIMIAGCQYFNAA